MTPCVFGADWYKSQESTIRHKVALTPCVFGADWYNIKDTDEVRQPETDKETETETQSSSAESLSWNIDESDLNLEESIGWGGCAEVFAATLRTKDGSFMKVAAKRLAVQTRASETEAKEHDRELSFLCQLKHKNIISFIGVVITRAAMILVSELALQGSLYDFLRRQHKPLSERCFYRWLLQAAYAIQYLKKHGVVHRDIKSLNYLVMEDKTLKLCDFGVAESITRTVDTNQKGSFPWMAPEVFIEQKVSPKSDVYSYGIVVWELQTRKIPFEGMESGAIMWAVGHKNKRPEIPSDCPQPIRTLLDDCWQKDRHKRPDIDQIVADVKKMSNLLRLQRSLGID